MIGKVLRGTNAGRLLYYLYGPGKANEHTDPHLVAGFCDPQDLEPERRPDGSRDLRRLSGLLAQPLAALRGPGYAKPVWHCALRAAPGDRMLSDAEWAEAAATVMDRTGLAPADDDLGVRWVAVRHAPDHVHIVATLARQDAARPGIWNDFLKVRDACREVEMRFGLTVTAPADRTAARRPARSETEQAARRGWGEAPRVTLRREVSVAAAGARTEQEFFARLAQAGVVTRQRYSVASPGQVTGYAVGLAHHTARDGGTVWYGGGKLAADLTLPKLRQRWAATSTEAGSFQGHGLSPAAARAVLRSKVTSAARRAGDEARFFARLREDGLLVRLRFSDVNPGQVTGYAVGLPGHDASDGTALWYGGGRLAAELTLPRLRRRWGSPRSGAPERSGAFRFTAPERDAIFDHAARQAAAATEHIRRSAWHDPAGAADAAWAAADTLHVAARALGNQELRRAADSYDRAARARYGVVPPRTSQGNQLREAARLMSMTGALSGGTMLVTTVLIANLVALAVAVAELREAQQLAGQAAAARAAAGHLNAATPGRRPAAQPAGAQARTSQGRASSARLASGDFPASARPGSPSQTGATPSRRSAHRGPLPPRRAGPSP